MSAEPILSLRGVSKRFGGLQALGDVTFDVRRGEILGLIGPNGAGKTTLFSALVGLHRIDSGSILLGGREIARLAPHRVAALGLTKTFQNVALFADASVLDNVLIGGLLRRDVAGARAFAAECLARVGLTGIADKKAGDLSFPERARVEVARALATEPTVLLLDEVMAALNHAETAEIVALLRQLRAEGLTLIVVEHHMKTVMALCDRIVALSFGRLLASGSPAEIARHPDVVAAYLGREYVG
ncbi:ABC transporter ATP-binding protein [Methylobacterium aerolatum]|uniref:Branched-chain amino acid transport system ATP-binding protein n=1 Tax=Methylobacterium aerolatum TaxID=418708 RepID=A0ABU0I3R5_9HYPH|nr:ATP-binding cassette domain-containing protein [Methylobacterium aerolatum]MDQ0448722.1 branched-chain amino acid transport system ATP-binding protein [Methylobacterium aerolatum]GJD34954.1 Lipopolysaccharide export system ATP-binding protein LptB [Methylobacterium aerolatum]